MTNKKNIREKGKIRLSEYFKKLKVGDNVAIVQEKTMPRFFPKRIIGLSGKVTGNRGECHSVELNDGNMRKMFIIHPINLKKLT